MTVPQPRRGVTLIEMLVVMSVLVVLMLVGTGVLVAALRANQVVRELDQRVTERDALADQFRADAGSADAAPDRFGPHAFDPGCLILRRPDGSHVVYRWADRQLTRTEVAGGKESARGVPLGGEGTTPGFERGDGPRPAVALTLTDTPRTGPKRRSVVAATLGGDLR